MGRRILLINIVMLLAIVLCAQQLVSAWQDYEATNSIQRIVSQAVNRAPAQEGLREIPEVRRSPFRDYSVIADKNLFSPDRRPEAEEMAEVEPPRAPEFPKPPQMNGVTVIQGETKALLTIFPAQNSSGEPRRVGIGDEVQGWVVSEINDSTVVLRWNDQQRLVDMFASGPAQTAQSGAGATSAGVNIINIGQAAPAVETSSSQSGTEEDQQQGLQVARVGSGAASQGQLNRGRGRGQVQDSRGRQGRGLPGNVGIPSRNRPNTQQGPPPR